MLDDIGDGLGHLIVPGNIRCDGNGFDFFCRKAGRNGFRLVEIEVEDRERRTAIGKAAGEGTPKRSTAAGDDDYFVLQSEVPQVASGQVKGSEF
jgi:hypothetical protein